MYPLSVVYCLLVSGNECPASSISHYHFRTSNFNKYREQLLGNLNSVNTWSHWPQPITRVSSCSNRSPESIPSHLHLRSNVQS